MAKRLRLGTLEEINSYVASLKGEYNDGWELTPDEILNAAAAINASGKAIDEEKRRERKEELTLEVIFLKHAYVPGTGHPERVISSGGWDDMLWMPMFGSLLSSWHKTLVLGQDKESYHWKEIHSEFREERVKSESVKKS